MLKLCGCHVQYFHLSFNSLPPGCDTGEKGVFLIYYLSKKTTIKPLYITMFPPWCKNAGGVRMGVGRDYYTQYKVDSCIYNFKVFQACTTLLGLWRIPPRLICSVYPPKAFWNKINIEGANNPPSLHSLHMRFMHACQ